MKSVEILTTSQTQQKQDRKWAYDDPNPQNIKMDKQKSKQRAQLIRKLCDDEKDYISRLKIIIFFIRVPIQQYLHIQQSWLFEMFDEIAQIIQTHSQFLHLVNFGFVSQELFIREFSHHIDFVAFYAGYLCREYAFFQLICDIYQQNQDILCHQFSQIQGQLRDYIFLPQQHLLTYNKFLNMYKKQTPQPHVCKLVLEIEQAYRKILKNMHINISYEQQQTICQQQDASTNKISLNMHIKSQILNKIKQQFQYPNIQYICDIFIKSEYGKIVIVRVGNDVVVFGIGEKGTFHRQFFVNFKFILHARTQIIQFPQFRYLCNRVAIADAHSIVSFSFKQRYQKNQFCRKLKLLISGINPIVQIPQQQQPPEFNISFKILGIMQRFNQNKKCTIQLNILSTNICQHIFIKLEDVKNIIQHYQKTLKINFDDCLLKRPKIRKNQEELVQFQLVQLQNMLNCLVRMVQFRQHPQYLFHSMNVFQGIWQLINTPNDISCENLIFQQLSLKDLIHIMDRGSNLGKNQLSSNDIVKVTVLMREREQKKQVKQLLSYQKLSLWLRSVQNSLIKLKKNYRRLKSPKVVKIRYQYCFTSKYIEIPIEYREETIQDLLERLCNRINLKFYKDFHLYRVIDGKTFSYDPSQSLSNIHDANLFQFRFGKKWYFEPKFEVCLAQDCYNKRNQQQIGDQRMQLITADIVNKIKSDFGQYDPQVVKQISIHSLELFYQKQKFDLNQKSINTKLPFLQKKLNQQQAQQLINQLKFLIDQKRDPRRIFNQVIKIAYEMPGLTQYKEQIRIVKQINSSEKDQYHAVLIINHEGLQINFEDDQHSVRFEHFQYEVESSGNCISLRDETQYQMWLYVIDPYQLWKRIKVYQKVNLKNPRKKNRFSFLI